MGTTSAPDAPDHAAEADAAKDDAAGTVAPAGVLVSAGRVVRRRRRWPWILAGALVLLCAAVVISAASADRDTGVDLLGLTRSTADLISELRWQYLVVVVVLAGLHYLATAIAARAAAGLPLPLGETVLVQLAAAAANRVTPAGIGGSAVTARYFSRRGLQLPAAVGAVAALSVLGSVSDTLVLIGLGMVCTVFGLHGSAHELSLLTHHVTGVLGTFRSPWLWLAVGLVGVAVLFQWLRHDRTGGQRTRRQLREPLLRLLRDPAALVTLLVSSGCTTLILAFAFVATTKMVPGPAPAASAGVLLMAFMLGSAAGSAVPIPAGLGSTEAALIAVLVGFAVPSAHAIEEVLIFRLVTFWAPAAVGIFATRYLHRTRAL